MMDFTEKANSYRVMALNTRKQAISASDPELRSELTALAQAYDEMSRRLLELPKAVTQPRQ